MSFLDSVWEAASASQDGAEICVPFSEKSHNGFRKNSEFNFRAVLRSRSDVLPKYDSETHPECNFHAILQSRFKKTLNAISAGEVGRSGTGGRHLGIRACPDF